MISCNICGKLLLQITRNHLVNHNITIAQYKEKFVNAPLQDESIIMRGSKNPFYGKKHTDEVMLVLKTRELGIKKPPEFGENISRKHNAQDSKLKQVMSSTAYKDALSKAVTNWWKNLNEDQITARVTKMRYTNESTGYWLPLSKKTPFDAYAYEVRRVTEITYMSQFYQIANANLRGKGYDLDHRLSIYDGFKLNVPLDVVTHRCNLQIIPTIENQKKNRNSSISYEELLKEISQDV